MAMDLKFYYYHHLKKFLKQTLILHRKDVNGEAHYSYGEVIEEANKLQCLMQKNGVDCGGLGIALHFGEHTPALCVGIISILNCSCYFSPLEHCGSHPIPECNIRKFGSSFILTDTLLYHDWKKFRKLFQCTIFETELFFYQINVDRLEPFPNSICYSIGTSGTTGESKAVFVPYSCIASNVDALSKHLDITSEDVIMLFAPISFDPFVIELFLALRSGATIIVTPDAIRKNPKKLVEVMFPTSSIKRKGATILQMTPSLFRLLVTFSKKNIFDETNTLRVLLLGGEEFPSVDEWNTWMPEDSSSRSSGIRIFNLYGITEISCWSTIYELVLNKRTPLGTPLDSETKLRLIDDKGNIIHHEGMGELQIGNSSRTCFLSLHEAKSFDASIIYYRNTGDIVERDKNSSLFFIGRLNNMIKRFGKQICLNQIEKKIKNLLHELHANVACVFEETSIELIVFIELRENESGHKQKARTLINNELENYQKPDKIIFVNHIPLTGHGKKCGRELTEYFNSTLPPQLKFQQFIEKTLGIKYTSIEENLPTEVKQSRSNWHISFKDAGGTSFHALSLASGIGMHFSEPEDNKHFLNLLLDENILLVDINKFLKNVKFKKSLTTNRIIGDVTAELKFLWKADLRKCVDATPSLCNQYNCICVGSHARSVFTLNATTGEALAITEFPDRIEGQVTFISDSIALVGCYDGHIYSFDFLKGRISWKLNLGSMIKSKPLLVNDCIIVSSYASEGNLTCISLKTRNIVWQKSIGIKGILATPLLLKLNKLIVCSLDGTYACVCAERGGVSWKRKLSSPIFSKPATIFDDTQIIIAEVIGKVNICSLIDGTKICHYVTNGHIFSGICVNKNDVDHILILFGCHDYNFYCLKYNRNEQIVLVHWKYCLMSPIYSTGKLFRKKCNNSYNLVCACSTNGLIVILNIQTGHLIGKFQLDGEIFSSPCISECKNNLYIGCRNNFLYCLNLESIE